MIDFQYLIPAYFIESLFSLFVLSKVNVNPDYLISFSRSSLISYSLISYVPKIYSFIGQICMLSTIFLLYCLNYIYRKTVFIKTIAIWTNSIYLSIFGLIVGILIASLDQENNICILILLYSMSSSIFLGNKYIEYVDSFHDKLPLLVYSLSMPIGISLGYATKSNVLDSSIVYGCISGTFLSLGYFFNDFFYSVDLSKNSKVFSTRIILLCILCGFIFSSLLYKNILRTNKSDLLYITNSTSF